MAYHGGQTSLARAHRPRAPIMSVPAPVTAPLAPLRQQPTPPPPTLQQTQHPSATGNTSAVTLSAPRPTCQRTSNEYVETPFRVAQVAPIPPPPPRVPPTGARPNRLAIPPPPPPTPPTAVTKQPASKHLHQRLGGGTLHDPLECGSTGGMGGVGGGIDGGRQSIMCSECGKCRCPSCEAPRPLPECWMCDGKYLCSADTVVDYVSCLCCAKALFYHCSEADGGGATCADDPCSCGPPRRAARWTSLAALSCALPCLWLYWPLRCAKRAVEACYARHSRQGCRCRPPKATTAAPASTTPEKRLLDNSSPDF